MDTTPHSASEPSPTPAASSTMPAPASSAVSPAGADPGAGPGFLAGRTALVTGAAAGIGRACAVALARAGAAVHVVDLDEAGARQVAREIGGTAWTADLADPSVVETLPADADIVVNNAGLQHVAPLHEFPPERFALIQRVMVEAPFRLMRSTLPHMYAQRWGRFVNISSAHGLRASAYKSAYVAAKHALEGLSKVAALEGAEHGVTSNCVNPGYVRTALVEGQIADQARAHGIPEDQVVREVLLERTAIKRLIAPEQVAAAVVWLCSPPADLVTGISLPMDGGWTAG